jgi:hypothetical protein
MILKSLFSECDSKESELRPVLQNTEFTSLKFMAGKIKEILNPHLIGIFYKPMHSSVSKDPILIQSIGIWKVKCPFMEIVYISPLKYK